MKVRVLWSNHTILLFISVFLPTFIVYLSTLARSLVAFGDAPEFVVAVLTNGIPHPSGYPLFVLLGKLAISLPLENKIMLINGVSAVFGSLTCSFVALTVYKITRSFFSSLLAALVLGFSFLFWKYSIVSEPFTLNTFFAAILIYLALTLTSRKRFYIFAIFAGLSLANHLTILLIFPSLFYILWKQKLPLSFRDYTISLFLFLTFGLLPYSYLWWAGQHNPLQSWGNTATLSGISNIMFRKAYGSTSLSVGNVPHATFSQQIISYLSITNEQFTLVGIGLFLLGLFALFRIKKDLFVALLSSFLLSGIVFILFAKTPLGDVAFRAISERFLLLSEIFFALIVGVGFTIMLAQKSPYRLILTLLFFLLPIFLSVHNFKDVNQKRNMFTYNLADDIFTTTPKGSLLLVRGDPYYSSVLYAYLVERKRQDLAIIFPAFFTPDNLDTWYRSLVHRHFPDIILPPFDKTKGYEEYIQSVISQNLEKRPVVCACGYTQDSLNLPASRSIGLTDIYFSDPKHINLQREEEETDKVLSTLKNNNPRPNFPVSFLENEILTFYARPYVKLSDEYGSKEDLDNAERLLRKALPFSPQNYNLYLPLTNIYLMQDQPKKAIEVLESYIHANPYGEMVGPAQKQLTKLRSE